MSSEIERNEDYLYNVQDGLPWHGMGLQENHPLTIDEVVAKLPRMAETPILCRIFYQNPAAPIGLDGKRERSPMECDSKRAIVYPSDGKYIGMATNQYQPKAYAEAFKRAFGWVEELGAWVSGAALLRGGSRAFITARVPALDFTVEKDRHQLWLTIFGGSDGVTGIYPYATFVRPVCANTVAAGMAEASKNGRRFSVAHHGNVDRKLDEASVALGQLAEVRDAYGRACEQLLNRTVTRDQEKALVEELVKGESTRAENARNRILHLAHFGRGNKEYQGTAYALWQGVTDYVDHDAVQTSKGDVNERRFLYAVEGAGATLKDRALALFLPADKIAA